MFWFLKQTSKLYQTLYVSTLSILGGYFQMFFFINKGNISDIICMLILFFKNHKSLIQISMRWKTYSTIYVSFPTENQIIKKGTMDISDNFGINFIIFQMYEFLKQRIKNANILC